MRTQVFALVVLVALAVAAAQQTRVFTNREEYLRSKAEYDQQKKAYDLYQSLTGVPTVAGYDLITKTRDADEAPGRAEQLLPTYTGMPVNFKESSGPGTVEPGNTVQNYFHKGPIPDKTAPVSTKPVVIPTAPGQDFIVPQDDAVPATPAVEETPTPAPFSTPVVEAAPAPAPIPAPVAAPAAPAFAPAPAAPAFAPAFAPAQPQQALFFGRGALPVTTPVVQADAPLPASVNFAPFASTRGLAAPVPLRPLSHEFQFGPYLPHSDFHPGPVRSVPPVDPAVTVSPFAPAPSFASAPAPVFRSFRPAERYGGPGAFIRR